ncbi:GlsB/YeaQ/YmgE family stress response membrane protein [Actinoplanes sp. KI2]|uniref:GlsB/YeaQ/YmgE family stress response membrane protein n=1 Tax=Actinoplanes sp. KI2 TaxID=2983315 RepID=UPI0021D599A7|nr:GlsB/YeaQ/YmgE family stress response membrane protein [Actinoplanes sp. KI2]MCU7722541.1 GlsB/YeaQ/YmgE family stress response membrane protein [Actinoplanes sp. KI2]
MTAHPSGRMPTSRKISGPASWLVSIGRGLAGALVGYVIFTLGLSIGDDDIFDWGGILSAIIGTLIVIPIAGWLLRRSGRAS